MAFLSQRTGDQLDEMNRHDRDVPTTKNCDPSFAFVLEKSQFLGKCVNPVKGRKIKGTAQRHPAIVKLKLAAMSLARKQQSHRI